MSTDLSLLSAALDRVVPAIGDLPGAGAMGLAEVIVENARQDRRFESALGTVAAALPAGFGDNRRFVAEVGEPSRSGDANKAFFPIDEDARCDQFRTLLGMENDRKIV